MSNPGKRIAWNEENTIVSKQKNSSGRAQNSEAGGDRGKAMAIDCL